MNIPFSPPDISELEIEAVTEALRSGWITTGPKTKEFEKEIASFVGVDKAVCLNSQTACAEMALRVLGIGPGDECVVPAYTYTASASVVCHVGARLKMVDVQKDSFQMDYDALEEAITDKTKVIIPVDLFGIPADYDRIFKIVESKKALFKPSSNEIQRAIGRVIVMADAAHSFGALYKGMPVGGIADFANFSFHAVKNLTTAEGGAVTWKDINGIDNEEIYKQYMLFSLHGQNKDALAKTKAGAWEYDIVGLWYKCNMTDIHAAIGLSQIKRYDGILKRRKEIIEYWNKAFVNMPVETVSHYTAEYSSSGHLYPIRLLGKGEEERNKFIEKMAELGVSTNVHYKPLPMHTGYKKLGFNIKNYPNAYEQYKNVVTLPLHTKLSDEDVSYVAECVKKCL